MISGVKLARSVEFMIPNKYFIIDFDSTFTKVEAFDVLAESV